MPAIQFGGGSNHLELTCVGSTLTARINGMTVATVTDSTYASGRSALGVSSVSNRPTAAYFDNLQVIQE